MAIESPSAASLLLIVISLFERSLHGLIRMALLLIKAVSTHAFIVRSNKIKSTQKLMFFV